jgi:hypothetical protein
VIPLTWRTVTTIKERQNMTYDVNVNLNLLEQDIESGRISFETGIDYVPQEERERFLWRLNRFISNERLKALLPERLSEMKTLDDLVSAAITTAHFKRTSRATAL